MRIYPLYAGARRPFSLCPCRTSARLSLSLSLAITRAPINATMHEQPFLNSREHLLRVNNNFHAPIPPRFRKTRGGSNVCYLVFTYMR